MDIRYKISCISKSLRTTLIHTLLYMYTANTSILCRCVCGWEIIVMLCAKSECAEVEPIHNILVAIYVCNADCCNMEKVGKLGYALAVYSRPSL